MMIPSCDPGLRVPRPVRQRHQQRRIVLLVVVMVHVEGVRGEVAPRNLLVVDTGVLFVRNTRLCDPSGQHRRAGAGANRQISIRRSYTAKSRSAAGAFTLPVPALHF